MKWKQLVMTFVYIILALFKDITDNKNTTANRTQSHRRIQYNFYWLFNNSIKIHYKQVRKIKKNALLKGPGN